MAAKKGTLSWWFIKIRFSQDRRGAGNPMWGKKISQEECERRRVRFLGKKNPQWGKHISGEHKEAIKAHHVGKPSGMLGKSQTEQQKEIMRKRMCGVNNPRYGVIPSEETRKKISAALVGKYNGEKCVNWMGGVSFKVYCKKFNKLFKNRVRAFFNERCVLCGSDGAEYGQRVAVHHVNYDKEACCSNGEPLFVTLCKSCHGKTTKDRGMWEKYFTELLRENYNNKCYFTIEEYQEYIINKN